jgi:hypothetical protein
MVLPTEVVKSANNASTVDKKSIRVSAPRREARNEAGNGSATNEILAMECKRI